MPQTASGGTPPANQRDATRRAPAVHRRRTSNAAARRRRCPPAGGRIVDLFAGAGGWDEGLRALGHKALGIELDATACQTAQAAGHQRLQADIAALDPAEFVPVWGLIGSPPCQAYSSAGKKLGRLDQPHVVACAHELAAGNDTRTAHLQACRDERSLLTVEPLRWALALRPRWIALEQVPGVLGLWTLFAQLLAGHGYRSAVGVLSAEQYGVPQTRKRCFLIASLDGPVELPVATHRSYNPRRPDHQVPGEERLVPWVSMARALGWPMTAVTYTNCQTNSGRRPRGLVRAADRPSRTVDSMVGVWTVETPTAATPDGMDTRQKGSRVRDVGCPSPTLTCSGLSKRTAVWTLGRPATTVMTDGKIQPPGHKRNRHDPPGRYPGRASKRVLRITVEQAAILQGFRPDYPWQGSRTRQFLQIGNAVCPPVAQAVLREAIRPSHDTPTPDQGR